MGLTKPLVPVDDLPVDRVVLSRILKLVSPEMILVGGQALAFWMLRFGIGGRRGGSEQVLSGVTTDVDFLGTIDYALELAHALGAGFAASDQRAMTSLVGQVRIPAAGGLAYNVDILHQIYDTGGLAKSAAFTRRARARASEVQLADSRTIRILHPLDVLASRIQNAAGLAKAKGPHVVTQARWSVRVARRAMEQLTRHGATRADRPGALAAEIFRLAMSRAGRAVRQDHGIEVADAIPFDLMVRRVSGFENQAREMLESLRENGRMHTNRGTSHRVPAQRTS